MSDKKDNNNNNLDYFKARNVTIIPKVALLMNQCKAKRIDCRIVVRGEQEEDKKDFRRMTIVIEKNGTFLKQYYG